jgi:EAL domain-containing protein (putative c-di-GMP-specific phosphodiesterase class I)
MGVQLALDDFGTGFSSLSYLRRLPIDVVKIDRAFISDLNTGTGSNAIVEAVTHMAHQLGFTVIAEGVETQSQRDTVAHIGCDSCQGFYYAKAMPADILATQIGTQTMKSLHLPAEDQPLDGSLRVPAEQPRRA